MFLWGIWHKSWWTLSQTITGFYVSAVQVFWKRNKQFLFFPTEFSAIVTELEIVVCKLFQFGRV